MTTQQWEDNQEHLDDHIMWPATKEEILAACNGKDMDESLLEEMKEKLPDGNKKLTKEEVQAVLVEEPLRQ